MGRLTGRVVVVTGAGQGIGAEYARALALEGASVALCDLDAPTDVARDIEARGGVALAHACDVTDRVAVEAFFAFVAEKLGPVVGLVNNAAIFSKLALTPMSDLSSADWDRVMAVNVRGAFECSRAALPAMQEAGYGKVVNVASATVFKGFPLLLHYVASKGAVVALTRSMAREVGRTGVRVNCVAPGLTLSEGVKDSAEWTDEMIAGNAASRCLPDEATPDNLSGTVAFLLSADSDFITGQTIVVDGGSVTH